jgi:hypothetical protein
MKTFKQLVIFVCGLGMFLIHPHKLNAQHVGQTMLVHYMPWYASKANSGRWGWHWTMDHFDPEIINSNGQRQVASHDYPLIDLYDSNDPDALECHALLMKFAGIDGVTIDWYGTESFRDYAQLHRNAKHFVTHLKKAGLKFAVCYEDQAVKHMVDEAFIPQTGDVDRGKAALKWLDEHWFTDDAYVKIDGRPLLLVFGPQYFSKNQWPPILSELKNPPRIYGLPHLTGTIEMDGVFGWPPVSNGKTITPDIWGKYLSDLYADSKPGKSVISVAFPGFHDIYQQAQLHASYGSIDDCAGKTFAQTLALAQNSDTEIIQIATWNDYGEGTSIEPTCANGYRYLELVQKNTMSGQRQRPDDLRLPVELYKLKKRHAKDTGEGQRLREAADLLFENRCDEARNIIRQISLND